MLGNLDPAKLLVILVAALVVLGPERVPRVVRQLGTAWRELTRMREQVTEEVRSAIPDFASELPQIPRIKPGSISGFLNDLTRPAPGAAAGGVRAGAGTSGAGAPAGHDSADDPEPAGGSEAAALERGFASGPRPRGETGMSGSGGAGGLGGPIAATPGGGWASQALTPAVALDDPAMN